MVVSVIYSHLDDIQCHIREHLSGGYEAYPLITSHSSRMSRRSHRDRVASSVNGEETQNLRRELQLTESSVLETATMTMGSLGREGSLISRRFGHMTGKAASTDASTISGKLDPNLRRILGERSGGD